MILRELYAYADRGDAAAFASWLESLSRKPVTIRSKNDVARAIIPDWCVGDIVQDTLVHLMCAGRVRGILARLRDHNPALELAFAAAEADEDPGPAAASQGEIAELLLTEYFRTALANRYCTELDKRKRTVQAKDGMEPGSSPADGDAQLDLIASFAVLEATVQALVDQAESPRMAEQVERTWGELVDLAAGKRSTDDLVEEEKERAGLATKKGVRPPDFGKVRNRMQQRHSRLRKDLKTVLDARLEAGSIDPVDHQVGRTLIEQLLTRQKRGR